MDEEMDELRACARVRFVSFAADAVVVRVGWERWREECVRGRRGWCVGCRGCTRFVAFAVNVREEEERGEEDEDVCGDVDGVVCIWGDEGVGKRDDGDGGPEHWDEISVHTSVGGWHLYVLACLINKLNANE